MRPASSRSYSSARCWLGVKAAQANRGQGIAQNPVFFDGVVADLADAERAVVNAMQRLIDLRQQVGELLGVIAFDDALQPLAAR